jgi:hypothetical protein
MVTVVVSVLDIFHKVIAVFEAKDEHLGIAWSKAYDELRTDMGWDDGQWDSMEIKISKRKQKM